MLLFFLVAFESLFVVALFHIYNRSMYIIYFGLFFTPTNIKKNKGKKKRDFNDDTYVVGVVAQPISWLPKRCKDAGGRIE